MQVKCLLVTVFLYAILAQCSSIFDELKLNIDQEKHSKVLILILSRLGLANRLRSMADWYSIAIASERKMIVMWDITRDCTAGYTDLFEGESLDLTVIGNENESSSVEIIVQLVENMNRTNHVLTDENMWAKDFNSYVISKDVIESDTQIVITAYDGVLSMEDIDCQQYIASHSHFLSNLVPIVEVRNYADNLYSEYFSSLTMVGVHYRAHDPEQDWAVVPPLLGSPVDKVFGEGASIEDFARVMREIQSHRLTMGDNIRFFIASNSPEAKTTLGSQFPSAIFLGGDHRRDVLEGMKLALVEWILLSKSALILHTYGSTFAEQASMVQIRPIVGIWESLLLQHSHPNLPYCGNQQYARAYGRNNRKAKYRTGLNTDHSEVSVCDRSIV